jgi:GrpB-like predicted nucleotidyltransferase (UPF0157 family)
VIRLEEHDPRWLVAFGEEAEALARALGALATRIEHVGSTAVPGLPAKPVIDIQVSVRSLASLEPFLPPMARMGYVHLADRDPAFERAYPYFHKPASWPHTHHVHLCEEGSDFERRHIAFRDRLRASAEAREEYAALKRSLARVHGGATHEERQRYADGKSDFVRRVLSAIGGRELPAQPEEAPWT